MADLREKKKVKNKRKIVKVAKELFSQRGFNQTKISEIAKRAQVGVGTIYNYYSSKGGILLDVVSDFVEQLEVEGIEDSPSSVGSFTELLFSVVKNSTDIFDYYPKSFWREIFHVITEESEEAINLRKSLFGFDQELVSWVETMIEEHSDCFQFPISSSEASYALYGAITMLVTQFIYDERMTYEQLLVLLSNQIQFIFKGKLKEV